MSSTVCKGGLLNKDLDLGQATWQSLTLLLIACVMVLNSCEFPPSLLLPDKDLKSLGLIF